MAKMCFKQCFEHVEFQSSYHTFKFDFDPRQTENKAGFSLGRHA